MEYSLIRSRRKTLEVRVKEDGSLEVRAPLSLPRARIDAFLRSREGWIREKRGLQAQRAAQRQAAAKALPQSLPLLGADRPVRFDPSFRPSFESGEIRLGSCVPAAGRAQLTALYRAAAESAVLPRAREWAERIGCSPAGLRIGNARTSWGCCSGKNRITFSWRLAAASPACIDYVAVHELCHLFEHNHSPAFWALVGRWIPDWRARRSELQELARRLYLLGL